LNQPVRPRSRPPQLEILYRDEALVAVAKPSGLPVHRGWAQRGWTVSGVLARQLELARVHPLHRLDQSTSGVLLFGLSPEVARRIQQLFNSRLIHKRYLAVVRGVAPVRGHLDYPIPRAPGEPRVPAQSAWRLLQIRAVSVCPISVQPVSVGAG
jgi:tRNA pseudouridine65 synthase